MGFVNMNVESMGDSEKKFNSLMADFVIVAPVLLLIAWIIFYLLRS